MLSLNTHHLYDLMLKRGQLVLSFKCIVIENIRIDDPKNILPLLLEQKYF